MSCSVPHVHHQSQPTADIQLSQRSKPPIFLRLRSSTGFIGITAFVAAFTVSRKIVHLRIFTKNLTRMAIYTLRYEFHLGMGSEGEGVSHSTNPGGARPAIFFGRQVGSIRRSRYVRVDIARQNWV